MVAHTAVFKGRIVDEKREFQQHLLQHLRMTELGEELREAEQLEAEFSTFGTET